MNKLVALLLISLFGAPAFAMKVVNARVLREVPVEGIPSYFFKASRDGRYLGYTLFRNNASRGDQNHLLELATGVIKEIPGRFDPMFAHDDETMVIPITRNSKYTCAFYDFENVLREGRNAAPFHVDDELVCVYQSIGLLGRTEGRSRFRLVSEGVGLKMRDFNRDRASGVIAPVGPGKALCSGFNLKLPMISKDGRELGAFDQDRNSSVILSVAEDGTCTVKDVLKVWGGKMSFSYDGRYAAVHVFQREDRRLVTEFVEVPDDDHVANIQIFDRKTKRLRAVTQNPSGNSLYPEFTEQGTLIYIHHPVDKNQKVRFVEVKLD